MEQSPNLEGRSDRYHITPARYPPGIAGEMEEALQNLDNEINENKPKPRYSYLESVAFQIAKDDDKAKLAFLEHETNASEPRENKIEPVVKKTLVQQEPIQVNRLEALFPDEKPECFKTENISHLADDEATENTDSSFGSMASLNYGEVRKTAESFESSESALNLSKASESTGSALNLSKMSGFESTDTFEAAEFEVSTHIDYNIDKESEQDEECYMAEDIAGDEQNPIMSEVQEGTSEDSISPIVEEIEAPTFDKKSSVEDEECYMAEDIDGDEQNPIMMQEEEGDAPELSMGEEVMNEHSEEVPIEFHEHEFVKQDSGSYSADDAHFLEDSSNQDESENCVGGPTGYEDDAPTGYEDDAPTGYEGYEETGYEETVEETVEETEETVEKSIRNATDFQSGQYVDDLNLEHLEQTPEGEFEQEEEAVAVNEAGKDYVKVDKEEIPQNWKDLMPGNPQMAAQANVNNDDVSPRRSSRGKKVDYAKLNWGADESVDKEDMDYTAQQKNQRNAQKLETPAPAAEEPLAPRMPSTAALVAMSGAERKAALRSRHEWKQMEYPPGHDGVMKELAVMPTEAEMAMEEPTVPEMVESEQDISEMESVGDVSNPTNFSFELDTTPENEMVEETPVVEDPPMDEPEVGKMIEAAVERIAVISPSKKNASGKKKTPKRKSSAKKKTTPKQKSSAKKKTTPKSLKKTEKKATPKSMKKMEKKATPKRKTPAKKPEKKKSPKKKTPKKKAPKKKTPTKKTKKISLKRVVKKRAAKKQKVSASKKRQVSVRKSSKKAPKKKVLRKTVRKPSKKIKKKATVSKKKKSAKRPSAKAKTKKSKPKKPKGAKRKASRVVRRAKKKVKKSKKRK